MELQIQNLDDIQLAITLAVYNYKGSASPAHLGEASAYLKWMKKKRKEIDISNEYLIKKILSDPSYADGFNHYGFPKYRYDEAIFILNLDLTEILNIEYPDKNE